MAKSINYAKLVAEAGKTTKFSGSGQKLSGKSIDMDKDQSTRTTELTTWIQMHHLFHCHYLRTSYFGFPVVLPTQEEIDERAKN